MIIKAILIGLSRALMFVLVWGVMIITHELGHYLTLKVLGEEAKAPKIIRKKGSPFYTFSFNASLDLDNNKYRVVLFGGVLLGFLPFVLLYADGLFRDVEAVILIVAYLSGCWPDIKNFIGSVFNNVSR
jgi:hypothetical protein